LRITVCGSSFRLIVLLLPHTNSCPFHSLECELKLLMYYILWLEKKKSNSFFCILSHQRIWVLSTWGYCRLYAERYTVWFRFSRKIVWLMNFSWSTSTEAWRFQEKFNNPTLVIDYYIVGCQRSYKEFCGIFEDLVIVTLMMRFSSGPYC